MKKGLIHLVGHVLSITVKRMPLTFLFYALLSIGAGVSMAAITYFKQYFFDRVEATVSGGSVGQAFLAGVIMGLSLVLALILRGVAEILDRNCFRKVQGYMGLSLNQKASRIAPVLFEDNKLLDSINKAYKGLEAAGQVVSGFLSIFFMQFAYFIFMGAYLFRVKPMLLLLMLLSFLPNILGALIRYRLYANMEQSAAPYRRRYEYFGKCVYDRDYAKETRLLGGFGYFSRLFRENISMVSRLNWKTTKKSELTEIALRFVMLLGYTGTLIVMFYYLVNGEISVGIFAAVLSSIDQMFDQMEIMVNYKLGSITQQLGMAENYIAFLNLQERGGASADDIHGNSISLRGVSFRYPNATKNSINDLSLDIAAGETIAIVGENGAGKSTLVRLLMGLYVPDEGSVLIDGKNTADYAPDSIYRGISAVFQKYQRYHMSLRENVSIASTAAAGTDPQDALAKADLSMEHRSFPEGMDTLLGREFGGVDLSGGQWQRVAIARGFYRAHNLIVLDEPTAAIDPIEETKIYNKFAEISADKTAVIVTHRLGSAKIADRVVVMSDGSIDDVGTHDELMERCPIYSTMYQAQAKWYQ